MSYTLDSINNFIPEDLLRNSTAAKIAANNALDKDVFTYTEPNLKLNSSYLFQFKYIFPDGSESDEWSPAYTLLTSTETVPVAPSATVEGGAGFIKISLPTFPANALRVDVRISGGIFGDGTKVSGTFTAAGTKTIAAPGGATPGFAYTVTLLTVTPSKINGNPSSPVTVYVTDPTIAPAEPSVIPSTPTVSSVLGAIQLAWNGKTSSGGNQPNGFKAAKVYVGTSADFTPVDVGTLGANQVDVLNFSNGQNTLNISVGTLVNQVALTYNTNYFVKIKTTNGNAAQDSTAVLATGSPVQIGKVGSGDIVTVTADQITAGTIESQTITVGTSSGKHIKLNSSGNPLTIYGTGGTSDPLLSFGTNDQNQSVLTIKGNGTFSGNLTIGSGNNIFKAQPATGIWLGHANYETAPFKVNTTGYLESTSGKIGGWKIEGSILESATVSNNKISLNPATPIISLQQNGVDKITIDPEEGIKGPIISGTAFNAFKFEPSGSFNFGGDKIQYSFATSTLTIQNTNLHLNIVDNEDGTAGDKTIVRDEDTGYLTTGRAFFYGSTTDPRTAGSLGGHINSRSEYNNGSQGTTAFTAGDIWMQRE